MTNRDQRDRQTGTQGEHDEQREIRETDIQTTTRRENVTNRERSERQTDRDTERT